MSRTNRRDRRDRDERVMRAPPGLKRLAARDHEIADTRVETQRRKVLMFLRENRGNIVTVGSATGFGFSFRFREVWESFFPGVVCPSRK